MHFEETQKLGSAGFQIFYILSSLPPFFIVGNEVQKAASEVAYRESLGALIAILVIFIGLYFLLFRTSAKTRIDSAGLHYQYWPIIFRWKTIPWREITSIEVKKMSPLTDFGGWGYKFGRKKTGIILGGDDAIYVTKTNAKVFAISTLKPEAARSAIAQWAPEKTL
jgi:hypothetical protein